MAQVLCVEWWHERTPLMQSPWSLRALPPDGLQNQLGLYLRATNGCLVPSAAWCSSHNFCTGCCEPDGKVSAYTERFDIAHIASSMMLWTILLNATWSCTTNTGAHYRLAPLVSSTRSMTQSLQIYIWNALLASTKLGINAHRTTDFVEFKMFIICTKTTVMRPFKIHNWFVKQVIFNYWSFP